jgi:hypothetical protein
MTPLEMIAEWRKGCSCAPSGKAEDCCECTRGLIDALEQKLGGTGPQSIRLGGHDVVYAKLGDKVIFDGRGKQSQDKASSVDGQAVMTQKDMGELLIKIGEALLNDGRNHTQQAAALLNFMELHEPTSSPLEVKYRHLTEFRLYFKGYPGDPGTTGKIVPMMPERFAHKKIEDVWDLNYVGP